MQKIIVVSGSPGFYRFIFQLDKACSRILVVNLDENLNIEKKNTSLTTSPQAMKILHSIFTDLSIPTIY